MITAGYERPQGMEEFLVAFDNDLVAFRVILN